MRYGNNGIEIQYRECQILRDAAKGLLADGPDAEALAGQKDGWIRAIRETAEESEAKKEYAKPLAAFLSGLEDEDLKAVAEYAVSLVRKGKGIDIMVPFAASNRVLILPVNTHASAMEEYAKEEGNG